jgi:hypothetical protein
MQDVDQQFHSRRSQDADLLHTLQNSHPELVSQYDQMMAEVAAKATLLDAMVRAQTGTHAARDDSPRAAECRWC